jgi:calcium-dependent protein kinase
LRREVDHLRTVHHPYIIELEDVFEDANYIHLITELCTGGELYDKVLELSQTPERHFGEPDAAHIVRNILDAISYCHNVQHICHRDLKASNFLFLNSKTKTHIKIIDFGLSIHVPHRRNDETNETTPTPSSTSITHDRGLGVMSSRVGTPYYVAPEVLTQAKYTNQCDVWSIGVIAYLLLSGTLPFQADDERQTIKLIMSSDIQVEFPLEDWKDIPTQAQDFCRQLLQKEPDQRPTARDAMSHEWIVRHCGEPPPLRPANHWKDDHPPSLNSSSGIGETKVVADDTNYFNSERTNRRKRGFFQRIFRKTISSLV